MDSKTMKTLSCGKALQSWLEDSGSFIQRLKKNRFLPEVIVLRQTWAFPESSERVSLNLKTRQIAFIREVEICENDRPLMYARTVIPVKVLSGSLKLLAHLGKRSLGSVLFSYPCLKRSLFDIKLCHLPQYAASELWERQSLFMINQKKILLREVYLPDLVRVIESQ